HLLVELADAPAAAGAPAGAGHVVGKRAVARRSLRGEEDAVRALVGDGAAARGRQAQRTGAAAQHAGGTVPGDAGAELGEVLARVPPGEHVQHRPPRRLAEVRERGGATYQGEQVVLGP